MLELESSPIELQGSPIQELSYTTITPAKRENVGIIELSNSIKEFSY